MLEPQLARWKGELDLAHERSSGAGPLRLAGQLALHRASNELRLQAVVPFQPDAEEIKARADAGVDDVWACSVISEIRKRHKAWTERTALCEHAMLQNRGIVAEEQGAFQRPGLWAAIAARACQAPILVANLRASLDGEWFVEECRAARRTLRQAAR